MGIGASSPATALDVWAISIKVFIESEARIILVPSDGTYVVASGSRVKRTDTLNSKLETGFKQ